MSVLEREDLPLSPGFDQLVLHVAQDLMPQGWDVIENAPDTLAEAIEHYQRTGRVAVSVHSQYGCTVGDKQCHYAFRAWHDLIHVCNPEQATFDLPGEKFCAQVHRQEIYNRFGYTQETAFFGALIEIEIVAQNAFFLSTGNYPANPRAFALRWLSDRGFVIPDPQSGCVCEEVTIKI